jgi:hypothetical protein
MERYGSQWMIVREMAQGTSLQAYLQQNRPDLSQFFDLAFQMATALKSYIATRCFTENQLVKYYH